MKAVLCTISSDSHSWNLVFLELFLTERGFEVINLGVCTPIDRLCDAIELEQPDLVVFSSVNGHACIEAPQMLNRLRKTLMSALPPIVIGGKLGVDGIENSRHDEALKAAGFTEVFGELPGDDRIAAFESYLKGLRSLVDKWRAHA